MVVLLAVFNHENKCFLPSGRTTKYFFCACPPKTCAKLVVEKSHLIGILVTRLYIHWGRGGKSQDRGVKSWMGLYSKSWDFTPLPWDFVPNPGTLLHHPGTFLHDPEDLPPLPHSFMIRTIDFRYFHPLHYKYWRVDKARCQKKFFSQYFYFRIHFSYLISRVEALAMFFLIFNVAQVDIWAILF